MCRASTKSAPLLAGWRAGAIVVSHDREQLEMMDTIVELTSLGVTRYGGNWSLAGIAALSSGSLWVAHLVGYAIRTNKRKDGIALSRRSALTFTASLLVAAFASTRVSAQAVCGPLNPCSEGKKCCCRAEDSYCEDENKDCCCEADCVKGRGK
jgi:hypothetical protein